MIYIQTYLILIGLAFLHYSSGIIWLYKWIIKKAPKTSNGLHGSNTLHSCFEFFCHSNVCYLNPTYTGTWRFLKPKIPNLKRYANTSQFKLVCLGLYSADLIFAQNIKCHYHSRWRGRYQMLMERKTEKGCRFILFFCFWIYYGVL